MQKRKNEIGNVGGFCNYAFMRERGSFSAGIGMYMNEEKLAWNNFAFQQDDFTKSVYH